LLSNSKTEIIEKTYSEFNIVTVDANKNINSKGNIRGTVDAVLVKNYG